SPEAVYIDGTHIKANANVNKKIKKAVPDAALRYKEELLAEINADRENHGKKPFDDERPKGGKAPAEEPKTKERTCSTTDPECGMFIKGEHRRCFAYEAHTACDGHGFVLETFITPGNIHDSVAFDDVYDSLVEHFPEIHTVVADSAYKTPYICKKVFDGQRVLSTAYKRPMTRKGGHEWWKYVYDEYNDWMICPEYKTLYYSTTNKDGYREYKALEYHCNSCKTKHLCTDSKAKIVTRHVWHDYIELAEDARYTPKYKDLYKKRKETIERVFADAKEKHAMRYTPYRGLSQVTKWVKLKFAAMNLKKLAKRKWMRPFFHELYLFCFSFFTKKPAFVIVMAGFSTV
ncbi:transposase, partial [Tyzzerella sp. OttesenSCG-928-J15]|nr:transposase [Tyzzerella sp. OttesenSCG-928-J15]